jgi:hypothetical protein
MHGTTFCDEVVTGSPLGPLQMEPMNTRSVLALAAAAIAVQLAGCAHQPAARYSYYSVPCTPTVAAGASAPDAASREQSPLSGKVSPTAPPADTTAAADAPATSAANCIVAVPNYGYDYAGGYDPYWDYGWPYYGGIGFDGFFGRRFRHEFHDHDGRGFRQAGNFHAGGFHGGGGHGGGGHGR